MRPPNSCVSVSRVRWTGATSGRLGAGSLATAHGGVAKRKSSVYGSMVKGKKATGWQINPTKAQHWDSVVVHQGWLLKKGGLAKSWIKRYAVLYRTSMGHFL